MGRTFQDWRGYVVRIEDNRKNRFDFFHATKLLVSSPPFSKEKLIFEGQNGARRVQGQSRFGPIRE